MCIFARRPAGLRPAVCCKSSNQKECTTSLIVAEKFGKKHFHVMRDIQNLDCTDMFRESNFVSVEIIEKNASGGPVNKSYYNITRDGLMFMVMGYTGA